MAELQEHHHQLKLDHVRLSQLAERLKARGEQIVRELAEIDAEVAREAAQREEAGRQIDALAAGMDALRVGVKSAGEAHANAESALQASRVDATSKSSDSIRKRSFRRRLYQIKSLI